MTTILEALSKWRPPGGAPVRSIAIDVDEQTGEHTVTIRMGRTNGVEPVATCRFNYRDAMTLGREDITYRLIDAAQAAWAKAHEAAPKTIPIAAAKAKGSAEVRPA